jgi:DNA polymerase-3 subunit delta
MKLSPRDAPQYFAKPDPKRAGLLIYGQDAMRVALKRQDVIRALVGPDGEAEMRLERIAAADLRKDKTLLTDAIKASGFFPGQRVAFLEDAGDGLADVVDSALQDWRDGDAHIVVTAGGLNARSKLRKLFEGHPTAYAAAIYDDPPSRAEIETALRNAGLTALHPDAASAINEYARVLDPGDFRQFVEKLSIYKLGDPEQLSVADLEACAPATVDAELDDLIHVVAESDPAAIGPVLRRLEAQGTQPVSLCIATLRHFRTLHSAASDPGGPGKGLSRARPPVFGPRRDRMERQAKRWGIRRLEQAIQLLVDTDLKLRSSSPAPPMPVMERTLVRLTRLSR